MVINRDGVPQEYLVEGTTFSPNGSVKSADGKSATELRPEPLLRLAEIGSLCNDAKIVYNAVSLFFILFFNEMNTTKYF